MTFPLTFDNNFHLDFRFIPLIFSFFYGGFSTGIVLTALIMIYRFVLGGAGIYIEGLGIPFFSLLIIALILPRYDRWKPGKQIFFSYLCLTLSILFFILETQFLDRYFFTKHEYLLWIIFCIFNYITFWMVLYLQTSLKEMEEMSTKVIQFEKSHAINHLLVYISQQIFSPILSSKKSLKQMKEDSNLSVGQSFYITQALNELTQAEHSLKDYMTIMDPQQNDKNSIKLTKMIQETVQMIYPFASLHNVELQFLSTAENDLTLRDYSLLRFSLLNLIKNGVEACGPGGRVNVFLHELIDQFIS
jgi:two-component system sporulation sensor kinase B